MTGMERNTGFRSNTESNGGNLSLQSSSRTLQIQSKSPIRGREME